MSRIKQGLPGHEEDIERYRRMIGNMGRCGIRLLCLNFMVTGWQCTRTAIPDRGGAFVSGFDLTEADALGPMQAGPIPRERVWDNYESFIRQVIPAAEEAGVRLGLHPDDPPVPIMRGVGRILTSADEMNRALFVVASPALGLTFCQGSFRTMGEDPESCARRFADCIAFIHIRDVRGNAQYFTESFPEDGDTDMAAMMRTYRDLGLDVPIRPDHAPAMDGDPVHRREVAGTNVGYEANGMIYTIGYMKGLMQASGIAFH